MSTARPESKAEAVRPLRVQVNRFLRPFRRQIWQLAGHSTGYRDLLESYPAAAIAIAAMPKGDPMRIEAMSLLERGAPLYAVARALRLPLWYRRLPPEAFLAAPARMPSDRASDNAFGARILNLVPLQPDVTAAWLDTVTKARCAAGDEFALWVGRQQVVRTGGRVRLPVRALALYYWYSRNPGHRSASAIRSRWEASHGLVRAATEARIWLIAVIREHCLAIEGEKDALGEVRNVAGYEFCPLSSPAEIVAEGHAMRNCLADYIGIVAWGQCQLYGIRRDGQRVATLEVRASRTGEPFVRQLRGPRNADPARDVLDATMLWLGRNGWPLRRLLLQRFSNESEHAFQRLVWNPYAEAVGMPTSARPTIAGILQELEILSACGK